MVILSGMCAVWTIEEFMFVVLKSEAENCIEYAKYKKSIKFTGEISACHATIILRSHGMSSMKGCLLHIITTRGIP